MAEFTGINLKAERKKRNIKQWQVAAALNVSEDVIYRWESNKQEPEPDQVGDYLDFLGCPELWHNWMISNSEHYRRRNMKTPEVIHLAANIEADLKDTLNKVMKLNEMR